jgi:hypothetical protein
MTTCGDIFCRGSLALASGSLALASGSLALASGSLALASGSLARIGLASLVLWLPVDGCGGYFLRLITLG